MTLQGFNNDDFEVFTIPGLEPRMQALVEKVRPKLHMLGDELAPYLSAACGEPLYPHVAKHARRTVHPPADTWVAWSRSRKGYKGFPHFQIGLWQTHLFIQFAVIYECPGKDEIALKLEKKIAEDGLPVPGHFFWSGDHTKPDTPRSDELGKDGVLELVRKLRTVKKAELMCGLRVDRDDPAVQDGAALLSLSEETFARLLPLYSLTM